MKKSEAGSHQASLCESNKSVTIARTEFASTIAAGSLTAAALFTRSRDVDGKCTIVNGTAVQRGNRALRFLRRAHCDESKATASTRVAIGHQLCFNHIAMRGKCVLKLVFCGIEGKISNKHSIHTHFRDVLQITPAQTCSRPSGFESSPN